MTSVYKKALSFIDERAEAKIRWEQFCNAIDKMRKGQ
jgi:hypothetical protein